MLRSAGKERKSWCLEMASYIEGISIRMVGAAGRLIASFIVSGGGEL